MLELFLVFVVSLLEVRGVAPPPPFSCYLSVQYGRFERNVGLRKCPRNRNEACMIAGTRDKILGSNYPKDKVNTVNTTAVRSCASRRECHRVFNGTSGCLTAKHTFRVIRLKPGFEKLICNYSNTSNTSVFFYRRYERTKGLRCCPKSGCNKKFNLTNCTVDVVYNNVMRDAFGCWKHSELRFRRLLYCSKHGMKIHAREKCRNETGHLIKSQRAKKECSRVKRCSPKMLKEILQYLKCLCGKFKVIGAKSKRFESEITTLIPDEFGKYCDLNLTCSGGKARGRKKLQLIFWKFKLKKGNLTNAIKDKIIAWACKYFNLGMRNESESICSSVELIKKAKNSKRRRLMEEEESLVIPSDDLIPQTAGDLQAMQTAANIEVTGLGTNETTCEADVNPTTGDVLLDQSSPECNLTSLGPGLPPGVTKPPSKSPSKSPSHTNTAKPPNTASGVPKLVIMAAFCMTLLFAILI